MITDCLKTVTRNRALFVTHPAYRLC